MSLYNVLFVVADKVISTWRIFYHFFFWKKIFGLCFCFSSHLRSESIFLFAFNWYPLHLGTWKKLLFLHSLYSFMLFYKFLKSYSFLGFSFFNNHFRSAWKLNFNGFLFCWELDICLATLLYFLGFCPIIIGHSLNFVMSPLIRVLIQEQTGEWTIFQGIGVLRWAVLLLNSWIDCSDQLRLLALRMEEDCIYWILWLTKYYVLYKGLLLPCMFRSSTGGWFGYLVLVTRKGRWCFCIGQEDNIEDQIVVHHFCFLRNLLGWHSLS